MSPAIMELLIRAVITVGTEAIVAIMHAVSAGDVSAVAELAKVMPDGGHRFVLEQEALRIYQLNKYAGDPDATTKTPVKNAR